ncbi:MAG: mobilization protein [Brasilonema octagenarum HA4186-MV1]|nr:mobilization protein [Brasilonema octagenarum HA4186-MV1]
MQIAENNDAQIVTVHVNSDLALEESNVANISNTDASNTAGQSSELEDDRENSSEETVSLLVVLKENPPSPKSDATADNSDEVSNQEASKLEAKRSTSKTLETHTIHLIDGEKGGAGKSFVSRAFIEYCQYKGLDFALVDADPSNKDISKIYPGCIEAFFSDDEKKYKEADQIFELALKKSVLVNLPAQVYDKVTNWIDDNGLIDLGKQNAIRFVKWFVCTGGHDSVQFFLQSVEHFENRLTHVFVRNKGLCDEWSYIENLDQYKDNKNKYDFVVMDFPKLAHWEKNMVDRLQIKFESACSHSDFGVVSKQKVKNFLKEAYKTFEGTGLVQ